MVLKRCQDGRFLMDVTVNITGIVMCCNESVCGLELGCGYSIEKCYLDDFQFKED